MTLKEWAGGGLLVTACLVSGFGTANPAFLRWLVIGAVAAGLLMWALVCLWRDPSIHVSPADAFALLFLGYVAISLSWSSDPREGATQLVNIAAIVAVFMGVSRCPWGSLKRVLPAAVSLAMLGGLGLYLVRADIYGGFGNRNFIAEFFLIAMPFAVLWAWQAKKAYWKAARFLIPLGAVAYLLVESESNTRWFGLAFVGVVALGYAIRKGWWFAAAVAVLAVANLVLLTGFATQSSVLSSLGARLELWIDSAALAAHSPLLGHGAGSFNYEYPAFQSVHLSLFPNLGTRLNPIVMYAGAAHNELLQILAEYGLAGLAIAAGFAAVVAKHFFGRKLQGIEIAAGWSLGLALWLSLIGFPFHIPQTALLGSVALGVLCWSIPKQAVILGRQRAVLAFCSVILAGVFLFAPWKAYAAQVEFARVYLYLDSHPLKGLTANVNAHAINPWERYIRHQLILSLAKVASFYGEKVDVKPEAADIMYEESRSAGGDNPAILTARVEYLINSGRYKNEMKETEDLLARLKKSGGVYPSTWINEARFAFSIGDLDRATIAVVTGMELAFTEDVHRKHLLNIGQRIMELKS